MNKRSRVWLAFAIVLVGGTLLTWGHRLVQTQDAYRDVTNEPLSDRQRAFIESETGTSTTLFNLAFAALVGLVSLQVSGKRSQRPAGALPLAAAALLALSMYGSFLLRTRIAIAVGRGPLDLLASPGTDFPLIAQFWLFVSGILALLFWVFPIRGGAGIVLAAGLLSPRAAAAQDLPLRACINGWSADRHVELPPASRRRAEQMIAAVAREAGVATAESAHCSFTDSILDELRRRVVADGADVENPSKALADAIQLAVDTFDSRNFSLGDAVSRMVTLAQIWNLPSGLVVVRSVRDTLHVIATRIDGGPSDWHGFTNWTVRLPAGTYKVESMKAGIRLSAPQTITVTNGGRVDIVFPETRP